MSDTPTLPFTGERFTPECPREIFYEHWHRYALASTLVGGLDILDAACGEGYGSDILAGAARSVQGVDLDETSITHAKARYSRPNLAFRQANVLNLPFEDDAFDAIVSFETLEHLAEHDELLSEFKRVLRPSGWLLISSPDRKTYSDDTGYRNEYHVRELYRHELEALLSRHFPAWKLHGQKLLFQSVIWSLAPDPSAQCLISDHSGTRATTIPDWPALYYLAVCALTDRALPEMAGISLFGDRDESVYAHYNNEIRRNINARGTLEAYENRIRALEHELARAGQPWWRRLIRRR